VRYARKYGPAEALEQAQRQHRDRFVRTWVDDEGYVVVSGRLPPEMGAVVIRALDAAADAAREAARERAKAAADEATPTIGHVASRADALVDIAETFLASGYREGNA